VNYNTLVSAIQETMEDTSPEFILNIPRFIDRASENLFKDTDPYAFVVVTTVTATPSDAFIAAPTGEAIVKNIAFIASGRRTQLNQRTDEYLMEYWPVRTSTGVPKYYARINDTSFYMAPTPVSAYTMEITYIKKPVTISATSPTNFYTEEMGNALFYATMKQANLFDKAFEQAAAWEAEYGKEVARMNNENRRTRRDDRQANTYPAGENNTDGGL